MTEVLFIPGASGGGGGGERGPEGPRGYSVLHGEGEPSNAFGANEEFYIDTLTDILYGPKAGGVWPKPGVALKGAAGATGEKGTTGEKGEKGLTGEAGAAAPKPLVEHAFAIHGKLAVEAYEGYTVFITAPEEKQIEAADLRLEEGTEAEVTIRKNGAALNASYEKAVVKKGTPVRLTKTVALADKDYLDLNVISLLANAPGRLSVTLHERQVK